MPAPPTVLVLGGNFAGLAAAQRIRDLAGDRVRIMLVDRKAYLDYIPNIPLEIFAGRDPAVTMHMPLVEALARDGVSFAQAEVVGIDVDTRTVEIRPNERPGAPVYRMPYDFLVIALGAELALSDIDGFAAHGHSVCDAFHANRLIRYLRDEYRGGPIAVGSARFRQGTRGRPPWLPTALAACEGPPVEVSLSLAHWLSVSGKGGADRITLFTPAPVIAEDAGERVVGELLSMASAMGFSYWNNTRDIARIEEEGIAFADGRTLSAELSIVFPNWKPHAFLKGLPIADEEGFVITDMRMRNPDYPEVFACGDAAAITVPKLGAIGHQEADVVGRQIAAEVGALDREKADAPWLPEVLCIGDMGGGRAFYIHSNVWYGGTIEELRVGRLPYAQKLAYKQIFFHHHGRVPNWGLRLAEWSAERLVSA